MAIVAPRTPIKPSDINAQQHLWDAFGHRESEISAGWIVRFCQQRNNNTWEPFKLVDLQAFYVERLGRQERFLFNRLTAQGHVTVEDGVVAVSVRFVAMCHGSSPAS